MGSRSAGSRRAPSRCSPSRQNPGRGRRRRRSPIRATVARLQERVPGLRRAEARWPARRLPRRRAQGVRERGAAARRCAQAASLATRTCSTWPCLSGKEIAKGLRSAWRRRLRRPSPVTAPMYRHHPVSQPDRSAPRLPRARARRIAPASAKRGHGGHGGYAQDEHRRSRVLRPPEPSLCSTDEVRETVIVRRRERLTR
jgi:hypothetical protein